MLKFMVVIFVPSLLIFSSDFFSGFEFFDSITLTVLVSWVDIISTFFLCIAGWGVFFRFLTLPTSLRKMEVLSAGRLDFVANCWGWLQLSVSQTNTLWSSFCPLLPTVTVYSFVTQSLFSLLFLSRNGTPCRLCGRGWLCWKVLGYFHLPFDWQVIHPSSLGGIANFCTL